MFAPFRSNSEGSISHNAASSYDAALPSFMSATLPNIILFSAKHSVPSMFSAVAVAYASRALFARVHSSSAAVMQRFRVDAVNVPRLIAVSAGWSYELPPLTPTLFIHIVLMYHQVHV